MGSLEVVENNLNRLGKAVRQLPVDHNLDHQLKAVGILEVAEQDLVVHQVVRCTSDLDHDTEVGFHFESWYPPHSESTGVFELDRQLGLLYDRASVL